MALGAGVLRQPFARQAQRVQGSSPSAQQQICSARAIETVPVPHSAEAGGTSHTPPVYASLLQVVLSLTLRTGSLPDMGPASVHAMSVHMSAHMCASPCNNQVTLHTGSVSAHHCANVNVPDVRAATAPFCTSVPTCLCSANGTEHIFQCCTGALVPVEANAALKVLRMARQHCTRPLVGLLPNTTDVPESGSRSQRNRPPGCWAHPLRRLHTQCLQQHCACCAELQTWRRQQAAHSSPQPRRDAIELVSEALPGPLARDMLRRSGVLPVWWNRLFTPPGAATQHSQEWASASGGPPPAVLLAILQSVKPGACLAGHALRSSLVST